jgi:hypothetical protein
MTRGEGFNMTVYDDRIRVSADVDVSGAKLLIKRLQRRIDLLEEEADEGDESGHFNASELDLLKQQRQRANDLARGELSARGRTVNPRVAAGPEPLGNTSP